MNTLQSTWLDIRLNTSDWTSQDVGDDTYIILNKDTYTWLFVHFGHDLARMSPKLWSAPTPEEKVVLEDGNQTTVHEYREEVRQKAEQLEILTRMF